MPTVIGRQEWGAQYGVGVEDPGAEQNVVIHHSYKPALLPTASVEEEKEAWKGIEYYHVHTNHWDGIGYNYGVAPSGRILEGRGWKFRGAHAGSINGDSIGICLLINGHDTPANKDMIASVRWLISLGVSLGEIDPSFVISGHRDHMEGRTCPGDMVYGQLGAFYPHPELEIDLVGDKPPVLEKVDLPSSVLPLLRKDALEMAATYTRHGESLGEFVERTLDRALEDEYVTKKLGAWTFLAKMILKKIFDIIR